MTLEDSSSQRPFRVVIVGAGIVGLSLSHALQLAKIDHVVLEKHSQIVSLHGAALVILPSASRIFDQFGVLEKIKSATTPIANEYIRWPDGSVNIEPRTMRTMPSRFGLQTLLVDRQRCVEHLYESLPDKSFIRTSTRVERIEHTESGVKVHLADGTIEEGDLVVGADGVHSLTRELMWDWAAENDPSCIPDSDKKALFTSYKGIYGVSDHAKLRDIGPSDIHVCLGHGVTKLLFTQPEKAMWAIVFKDEYSQPPKRYKADEQETEAIVARFKDLQITSNLTFNDLWTTRNRHGLIAVEEGVLSKWHAGRIVLVGDSAHKVRSISNVECSTADIGVGANMAIESAAVLANVLQHAASQHAASQPNTPFHPSQHDLTALFEKYQHKRHKRAKFFADLSGHVTRMRSYETLWKRLFVGYIATTSFMQRMQINRLVKGLAIGPKLEYVDTNTIDEEAPAWKRAQEDKEMLKKERGTGSGSAWMAYVVVTSVVGMAVSYVAVARYGRVI